MESLHHDFPDVDWDTANRTIIRKVAQHDEHKYPSWPFEVVSQLRDLGRRQCYSLPPELARQVRSGFWVDVLWGLQNRMVMEYRVPDHSERKWLIVTEFGMVAAFRLGRRATLLSLFSPSGHTSCGGWHGRRLSAVHYLVSHNFPPGPTGGTWVFPDPGWIKHCDGHRNPEVRGCYRVLNLPGFGFTYGEPGERYQRPQ